jgi:hypothetical protein
VAVADLPEVDVVAVLLGEERVLEYLLKLEEDWVRDDGSVDLESLVLMSVELVVPVRCDDGTVERDADELAALEERERVEHEAEDSVKVVMLDLEKLDDL